MSAIVVTVGGLMAIIAIAWWFWLSTPQAARATGSHAIEIRVEGGTYQPAVIAPPANQPLTLHFLRIDATPCAEQVVFAGLGIATELPLGKPHDLALPPLPPGTYEFTCQMGMYRGKVIAQ